MCWFCSLVAAPILAQRWLANARVFALGVAATLASVSAGDRTWDGGGGDDTWTTTANWVGDVASVADDNVLVAGTTGLTPIKDFAADTSFSNITFNNTAGAFIISGARMTLAGNSTHTDSNTLSLTSSGMTTLSDGRLHLDKSAGQAAILGNVTNTGGTLTCGADVLDHISAGSINHHSGTVSRFNGVRNNSSDCALSETIAEMDMTGGHVDTGINARSISSFTLTTGMTVTGGAGTPRIQVTSATLLFAERLNLSDLTGTTEGTDHSFSLTGNTSVGKTEVCVGVGGLTGHASTVLLNRGTGGGSQGAKLVLDGNITTTGTAKSAICRDTSGGGAIGTVQVERARAAGAATRMFTVGGGADQLIDVAIENGVATPGGLTQAGIGSLLCTWLRLPSSAQMAFRPPKSDRLS